jgi:hypothetical protein
MLIKRGNGPNPLKGWQVDRSAIRTIGRDQASTIPYFESPVAVLPLAHW